MGVEVLRLSDHKFGSPHFEWNSVRRPLCLYNHLKSRISKVVGSLCDSDTSTYFWSVIGVSTDPNERFYVDNLIPSGREVTFHTSPKDRLEIPFKSHTVNPI